MSENSRETDPFTALAEPPPTSDPEAEARLRRTLARTRRNVVVRDVTVFATSRVWAAMLELGTAWVRALGSPRRRRT